MKIRCIVKVTSSSSLTIAQELVGLHSLEMVLTHDVDIDRLSRSDSSDISMAAMQKFVTEHGMAAVLECECEVYLSNGVRVPCNEAASIVMVTSGPIKIEEHTPEWSESLAIAA